MLHGPPYSLLYVEAAEAAAADALATRAQATLEQLLAKGDDGDADAVAAARAAARAARAQSPAHWLEAARRSKSLASSWPLSAPVVVMRRTTPCHDPRLSPFRPDVRVTYKGGSTGTIVSTALGRHTKWWWVQLDCEAEPRKAGKSDLALIPDADTVRAEDRINAADQDAVLAPEFGYIVDYRKSDDMYRIVFDDIKDAEDANYWCKRDVDWYKHGVDFEVL